MKLEPTIGMHGKPSKLRLVPTNSQLHLVVAHKDTQSNLSLTMKSPLRSSEKESLLPFSISLEPKLLMPGVLLMLFILISMELASSCKEPNLEMLQMMSGSPKEPLKADPNFKKVPATATLMTMS